MKTFELDDYSGESSIWHDDGKSEAITRGEKWLLLALFGIVAAFALVGMSACGTPAPTVSYAPPVKGGTAFLPPTPPAPVIRPSTPITPDAPYLAAGIPLPGAVIQQGDNANTPTTYQETTTRSVTQGTMEPPKSTVIPAATDHTPQVVGVIGGILMLLGAGALVYFGWPQIGARLGLAGIGVIIVSLTSLQYGWLWCLIIAGAIGWVIWEKVHGYNIGVAHGKLYISPATSSTSSTTTTSSVSTTPVPPTVPVVPPTPTVVVVPATQHP